MTGGYTVIPDWMMDLGLDLTSTFAYAVIYGFSQDGESMYQGSHKWLADKCKCSRDTIKRVLTKLVSMGFVQKIDREINGVKFCSYRALIGSPTLVQNAPNPGAKCTTNNIENIIDKEISTYVDTKKVPEKQPRKTSKTSIEAKKGKEKGCAEKEKGKFDFREALISEGVSGQTADDWLLIRSKKRAVDTMTAFKMLKKQLVMAAESGVQAEECITMAVTKSWAGFEWQWYQNEKTRSNGDTQCKDRRRGAEVMDVPPEDYYKPF